MNLRSYLALSVVITACCAFAVSAWGGDDLPVVPPKLGQKAKKKSGFKGPGVPSGPPVEPPSEDPRDVPAPTFYGEEIDAVESIVYVIDASRSMMDSAGGAAIRVQRYDPGRGVPHVVAWRSGGQTYGVPRPDGSRGTTWLPGNTRWHRAMVELFKSVEALSSNFRFNVFVYNCSIDWFRPRAVEATPANKAALQLWIMSLVRLPVGGTGTGPAVVAALADRTNEQLVLLTDGDPNCLGVFANAPPNLHRSVIRRANVQKARIDVFGIRANLDLMRAFCQGVASDSGGSYVDVR